jgi:hypothetical protein
MTERAQRLVKDASHINAKALPAAAGSVNSDGHDLGAGSIRTVQDAELELLIESPALTTTELPDTETLTYKVQHDTASDFSGAATLMDAVLVQTGAGAAGAVAANARVKLPSDCNRYIRVVATGSTSIGDCSGKSLTESLVF